MDLLEAYAESIIKHLPKDSTDISKEEIRRKIEKMLPLEPTEVDIRILLDKLGNPAIFAKEYSQSSLETGKPHVINKISPIAIIVSIMITIIITVILCFKPQVIGVHINNDHISFTTPLFMLDRLSSYRNLILLLAITHMSIYIYMLMKREWTIHLSIVNTVYHIAAIIVACVMLTDDSLFNLPFFYIIEKAAKSSLTEVMTAWEWFRYLVIFGFVAVSLFDSIIGFVKSRVLSQDIKTEDLTRS